MSPTRQLADSVRAYCEQVCERSPKSATVRIVYDNDTYEERMVDLAPAPDDVTLSDAEYQLLDFVNSLDDGQWLTASEIADKLEVSAHSRFRDRLIKLARLELIRSDRKSGYAPKKSNTSKKVSGAK